LRLNHRGQVAVGGGDDPHADTHRSLPSNANHFAVLQHTQESHLGRGGELANLVQEQRSAVGLLEPALAPRHCARERALLVAEQLGVDQLGSDRAAIHASERSFAKRRVVVDGAGDDLLPGSCFSEQQHRRVAPGDELGARDHRRQPCIAANQTLVARRLAAGDQMLRNRAWTAVGSSQGL
jgi:hypothetical protein